MFLFNKSYSFRTRFGFLCNIVHTRPRQNGNFIIGNIRAERDYDQYNFTLEGLRSEMQEEECVHIYLVPGHALKGCMKETWYVFMIFFKLCLTLRFLKIGHACLFKKGSALESQKT